MIIEGDSLEELRKLEPDSIDFICTDPPYGYSFMGKHWDKAVPSMQLWMECLRVLKPGGFINVMSAPRSDVLSRMIVNIEDAGFRVDFTPIYWTYASGFPKAGNIGKLVDKRLGAEREIISKEFHRKQSSSGGILNRVDTPRYKTIDKAKSDQAKALDGSYAGFQPKPAVEVIIVAMKPLSEKTFVDQALSNGKGISWLDDVRIPTGDSIGTRPPMSVGGVSGDWSVRPVLASYNPSEQGRFPANLLVSDDVLNDGVERKSGGRDGVKKDKWTAAGRREEVIPVNNPTNPDSGSYSRYFDLDKWYERNNSENKNNSLVVDSVGINSSNFERLNTLPFLIVPKASKSEKNKGLDGLEQKLPAFGNDKGDGLGRGISQTRQDIKRANHHPTVKPLKLMSYLITLFSREGDVVLDPFVGSGTTCIAAKKLNREYIGIERETEYVEIAEARLIDKQASLL